MALAQIFVAEAQRQNLPAEVVRQTAMCIDKYSIVLGSELELQCRWGATNAQVMEAFFDKVGKFCS